MSTATGNPSVTDGILSEIPTILPLYPRCTSCNRDLLHYDYFECLMEAGRTWDHIAGTLKFLHLIHPCCKSAYENIKVDVNEKMVAYFSGIEETLTDVDGMDKKKIDVRADAIYYLHRRGCGIRVACHLTRSPNLDVPTLHKKSESCPVCGNLVPNGDYVKGLLDGGLILNRYMNQYDIPRACCIESIISGKLKVPEYEGEFIAYERAVPQEATDFIVCPSCGDHISGVADDSRLKPLPTGVKLPKSRDHISGDSVRQAARWGLPAAIGILCHRVKRDCCETRIICPDEVILASVAFDDKTKRQTFAHAIYAGER